METTTDVGIKIVESMCITDTTVVNLHLCGKDFEDMKVLVTTILGKHEITETERAAVLQVIQKREKDCVSKTSVAAASVNPKYFYGDKTQVSTKARNQLGGKVKETLTEVKMSGMCKRAAETDKNKTYRDTDRVTVLGLVCEKMTERVVFPRQEEVDDDGFPDDREVWEVTHVCEEDLETAEGEGVDFLSELLELVGWGQVDDEETENNLS